MTDDFRQVSEFPQCFVDIEGNIYRRYANGKQHKMSHRFDRYGYKTLRLLHQGKRRSLTSHRLVCSAFHGPCPDGMMTLHLNGNRTDNSPNNLCWGTPQQNSDDKRRHGTICTGEQNGRAKLTRKQVELIRHRYVNGESQWSIATAFGIVQSVVSGIVLYEIWK